MSAPSLDSLARATPKPQHTEQPFSVAEINAHLAVLPGWRFVAADPAGRTDASTAAATAHIVTQFDFTNYYETIAFVNVIAAIAHATDHHPDLIVHYNRCQVSFNTHDVGHGAGGLSLNDFICAARIELARRLTATAQNPACKTPS